MSDDGIEISSVSSGSGGQDEPEVNIADGGCGGDQCRGGGTRCMANRVSMSELMKRAAVANNYSDANTRSSTTTSKPEIGDASTLKKANDDYEVPITSIAMRPPLPDTPPNCVVYCPASGAVVTRSADVGKVGAHLPPDRQNIYCNGKLACRDVEKSAGVEAGGPLGSSAEKEDCGMAGYDMPTSFVQYNEIPACCQPDDDPSLNIYECLDDFQSHHDVE